MLLRSECLAVKTYQRRCRRVVGRAGQRAAACECKSQTVSGPREPLVELVTHWCALENLETHSGRNVNASPPKKKISNDSFWDLWQTCDLHQTGGHCDSAVWLQQQNWSAPILLIVVFSAPAEPNKYPGFHLWPVNNKK